MPIKIKLSTGERIRRAVAAHPSMSTDEIVSKLGVTTSQIKAALAYTQRPPSRKIA